MLPLGLPQVYNPTKLTLQAVEEIIQLLAAFPPALQPSVSGGKDILAPIFQHLLAHQGMIACQSLRTMIEGSPTFH